MTHCNYHFIKDHKIYITKYKIKTICQCFPELIITEVDKTNPAIVTFTLSTSTLILFNTMFNN